MRVAHVGNYKPDSPNGVDKTIVGLVRNLPAHGVEVEVWHPTRRAKTIHERCEDGVAIHDLPVRRILKGICRFGKEAERFIETRARAVQLLHFHSVFQQENLKLSHLGIPYVVTPNGGYDALVLSGRNRLAKAIWLKLWERPFIERARMIQAVSLPELRGIEKFALRAPVRYIPNGIDDAVFRREATPPSRHSRFVFLGRLAIEQKGLDLLLQGYAKAVRQSSALPEILLAGPDFRGSLERLTAMAQNLGIADRIVFAGPVYGEPKWDLLSNARLFIHTSRWEGMPFALLEALAMGRPALVTPGTNLADEISQSRAGIIVERDADAIAAGLLQAARLPDEALDAMGRMARSMAQSKFTWQIIAGELSRAYRTAVAG